MFKCAHRLARYRLQVPEHLSHDCIVGVQFICMPCIVQRAGVSGHLSSMKDAECPERVAKRIRAIELDSSTSRRHCLPQDVALVHLHLPVQSVPVGTGEYI